MKPRNYEETKKKIKIQMQKMFVFLSHRSYYLLFFLIQVSQSFSLPLHTYYIAEIFLILFPFFDRNFDTLTNTMNE